MTGLPAPERSPSSPKVGFDVGTLDGSQHGTIDCAECSPLFCELLELRHGQSVWRETARWVKFEEDVEEGGNRWSKPFVASLSLHALIELRNCIGSGSLLLDIEASSLNEFANILVDDWVRLNLIPPGMHEALVATLLQPYKHQHQMVPSKKRVQSSDSFGGNDRSSGAASSLTKQSSVSSQATIGDDVEQGKGEKPNKQFFKKLPPGTEAASILAAELEYIRRPLYGFVRLKRPTHLRNLVEVPVASRYIFVALMPKTAANRVRELGRTVGTLFSDELFQRAIHAASDRNDCLAAVDEFMGSSTVLPPGEWNPKIRIEPPQQVQSEAERKKEKLTREGSMDLLCSTETPHESHGSDIKRTGRFCGGIIQDVKCKAKWYWADFKDALHVQCVASFIFLYFASMTPLVTFGGLMSTLLKTRMGALETILGRAISGIFWGFTAGQPLVILGSTGPILVFEVIVFNLCEQMGIEYMSFRVWIGLWSALILFLMVAFDSSYLVGYITRFTEESFAALVSAIFVYEAIKKLLHIAEEEPIRLNPEFNPDNSYLCECRPNPNRTHIDGDAAIWIHDNFTKAACAEMNGTLVGDGCNTPHYVPDAFLLSICLFFGTFILSRLLKGFKTAPYFPAKVRQMVSDFAVIISIAIFVGIDFMLGLPTPKLWVPSEFKPTFEERDSWLVPLFGTNVWWTALAAAIPGLLATILIFMDQQITTVIVSRKENKLRHGLGYHLDLFIVAILIAVLSLIGMPWMIADTVLSLTHAGSLRMESETAAPGEQPRFLGIREQRVTNICISIVIGASIFLTSILKMIPMPVLFGVFLFMGSNALMGLQFTDRMLLIFMPLKYQPDYVYLRHVQIKRVHLFTFIQLLCLATLWVLKSFQQTAMLFPIMVGALVGVRKLLDFIFTQKELSFLDDLMPEGKKRKIEDGSKKKKRAKNLSLAEDNDYFKVSPETGMIRIPLPNGHVLTVPVESMGDHGYTPAESPPPSFAASVQATNLWKNISSANLIDGEQGKNGGMIVPGWNSGDTKSAYADAETKKLLGP